MQDYGGMGNQALGLHRQQVGVAGAGAYQVHFADRGLPGLWGAFHGPDARPKSHFRLLDG